MSKEWTLPTAIEFLKRNGCKVEDQEITKCKNFGIRCLSATDFLRRHGYHLGGENAETTKES